jgi:hypothetical protein
MANVYTDPRSLKRYVPVDARLTLIPRYGVVHLGTQSFTPPNGILIRIKDAS